MNDMEQIELVTRLPQWPEIIRLERLMQQRDAEQISDLAVNIATDAASEREALTRRGVEILVRMLETDIRNGVPAESVTKRMELYGRNVLPPPKTKSLLRFLGIAMKERMVQFLFFAAGITVGIGIYETVTGNALGWLEGVAIIAAILIIVGVNAINDYRKQARFKKLTEVNKSLRTIKIVRDGHVIQIPTSELVVGDVASISTGDVMSFDGILLPDNELKTDESSLTGESRQVEKNLRVDPFLISGTTVVYGTANALVVLVGPNSAEGRMMGSLSVDPPPTPLQIKLGKLAKKLATIGVVVASITLLLLVALFFVKGSPGPILDGLMAVVLIGISIVVMAIPEGLPLAVTLALAYATIHMLKDNNLVRHLNACETMGGATTVCSDKTGTLTMNKMTVVKGRIFQTDFDRRSDINHLLILPEFERFSRSIMINTDAYEAVVKNKLTFLGSQTEIALLEWLRTVRPDGQTDYVQTRSDAHVVSRIPFNSATKMSIVTIETGNDASTGYVTFAKGASEIILAMCDRYVDSKGTVRLLDRYERREFEQTIANLASERLRTIACAFKEHDRIDEPCSNAILYGVFGLEDPLRPNAAESVKRCQRAGITVRMVTGDNLTTAESIARQCGILTAPSDIVIEGPRFREMSSENIQAILPQLRVMARSSPDDKLILVNALMDSGETVAVTGDGANDGPALKNSHVGFSMGLSGTEVAKEASDIVLLDDNFASIVRAILWGRAIYMGIQKFIMFQLSVNVSAVLVTIVTAVDTSIRTGLPSAALTTLQILLLNLIADSLAALALSTDPPVDAYLDRKPHRRDESIITADMWRMIVGQSIYQIVISLLVYYLGPLFFSGGAALRSTMVYATFVFMVIFNELNCRSVDGDFNIFRGIARNKFFLPLFVVGFVAQFFIVTYLGIIFDTVPLTVTMWIVSVVLGMGSLLVGVLVRILDRRK